ncbi:MAG: sterol desaturase [Halobacteriovorax sp.]|nr:sterol desaturase [Halobacteriovorax sp.]|tara:strand:+ start:96644 stop:97369 length:726 start_codon:yes stop_codon:yes gene_type:complete
MISTIAFIILIIFTLASNKRRGIMLKKSFDGWVLDLLNLPIQGILIPILQTIILYGLFSNFFPQLQGILDLHPIVCFLLNFIVVDYFYYWNHRILHFNGLWNLHRVHHSAEDMDVFATSRNTLWTSFLILYVWVNAIMIYLLKDPTFYVVAAGLSAALDLWKHSNFPASHFLSDKLFIATPIDHQWHHSNQPNSNFGANLNLWDKVHGTYRKELEKPSKLGIPTQLPLWKALLFPFKGKQT